MRSSDADLIIVPGFNGSGPEHWQTRWQAKLSTARRLAVPDWERPLLADWVVAVLEAVQAAERPVILIAHSLGVLAVVQAASLLPIDKVRGAFLVAPPAPEIVRGIAAIDPAFAELPAVSLPFAAELIASRDDPFCDFAVAQSFAALWGCPLIDAGAAGHINVESGHGPWPEGLVRLATFLKGV